MRPGEDAHGRGLVRAVAHGQGCALPIRGGRWQRDMPMEEGDPGKEEVRLGGYGATEVEEEARG